MSTRAESATKQALALAQEHPAAALTALSAFGYGILRLVAAVFYAMLGVSPGEVGLTFTATLARGAVGFVIVAVLTLMLLSFFIFSNAAAAGIYHAHQVHERHLWLGNVTTTVLVLVLAVTIYIGVRQALDGMLVSHASSSIARAVWIIAATYLLVIGLALVGRVKPSSSGRDMFWLLTVGVLSFLFAVLLATGVATDIEEGHGINPAIEVITGLQADSVEVTWLGSEVPVGFPTSELVYLGRADGILVLYDPDSDSVWRVPSAAVAVVGR